MRDQNGLLILDHDEHMRPDTTKEGLAKLKPAFEGLAALGGFDDVALQKYHWVERSTTYTPAATARGSSTVPRW